ncbi:MAG: hypothetical protein HYZ15_11510 [Sphingobacteriales bacterium]|nr:hypothetical protein [Sphingobacteriales bacterium]
MKITLDRPRRLHFTGPVELILYALPNGNSTEWTMGKKPAPGDDWHYNIQHIRAQTAFIRKQYRHKNYVVAYLENDLKSWPAWKRAHADYEIIIPLIVDTLRSLFHKRKVNVHLNGHSGGGSFIFGYMEALRKIPRYVTRISFLDSDYGYTTDYGTILLKWLQNNRKSFLTVFAYNDAAALYQGKRIVSDTGGTWYRSHLMKQQLSGLWNFYQTITDSLILYKESTRRIQFLFKPNPDSGIYHTQQVELNGFIHSVLMGTRREGKGYEYYGRRAYEEFIQKN